MIEDVPIHSKIQCRGNSRENDTKGNGQLEIRESEKDWEDGQENRKEAETDSTYLLAQTEC